jgi:hypothetical protein
MRRWTIGVMVTLMVLTSSFTWAAGQGHKRGIRYKGTVASVGPGKLMVSLTAPVVATATDTAPAAATATTQAFDIPANVRISCRGRACTLAELTPGTPIKVKTERRGDTTVVTEIKTIRQGNKRPGCGAPTGG